jgi:hypothetical protein
VMLLVDSLKKINKKKKKKEEEEEEKRGENGVGKDEIE